MVIFRRHTRIAIEHKTIRLAGVFPPDDGTARESSAQVSEVATIQSAVTALALPVRPRLHRLRSLYLTLRRVVTGRAEPGSGNSATSGLSLVAKPTVPPTKEPRP